VGEGKTVREKLSEAEVATQVCGEKGDERTWTVYTHSLARYYF
jgi:hypothetical protein